jgi:hypothetical protein
MDAKEKYLQIIGEYTGLHQMLREQNPAVPKNIYNRVMRAESLREASVKCFSQACLATVRGETPQYEPALGFAQKALEELKKIIEEEHVTKIWEIPNSEW